MANDSRRHKTDVVPGSQYGSTYEDLVPEDVLDRRTDDEGYIVSILDEGNEV